MADVIVVKQDLTSFIARSEGVYLIKEAIGNGNDRYILTRAIWVYEPSTNADINDGWLQVADWYADAKLDPENEREAVNLPTARVSGDGRPVQT